MKVLYFGTYERDYPRNAQVISCLRGAGVDVRERHISVWDDRRHKFAAGARSIPRILLAEAQLASSARAARGADAVLVGYPGHLDMAAAKIVARRRPVVLNPLVSLEDTLVGDRRVVRPNSLQARALRRVDQFAFGRADLVVADTRAHADYFADRFGLPDERVAVAFVGAEDRLFTPDRRDMETFEVLFVGKLIPLHGLETILAAAALCPDVPFRVVGSGQLDDLLARRPANVLWDRWVDYELLPALYRAAGCALGIFDSGDKAARVIPNKAYHSLATATPLVTADTPAARELLEDGRDALLVPPGDPEALAAAVATLANDRDLRTQIATKGHETYAARASEAVLGATWRQHLERLVHGSRAPAPTARAG